MPLPNFLIVGAPRAGTTSLYEWLVQHPDVFMSAVKEPNYFSVPDGDTQHTLAHDAEFVRDRASYEDLFKGSEGYSAAGEASTQYLESPDAPERIAALLGAKRVRLIAVLRDPADRAFSHYVLHQAAGTQRIPRFREALEDAPKRAASEKRIDWDYTEPGFYAKHIENYLRHFDRDVLKIVLFEDLTKNTAVVMADICRHIGIDPSFQFDTSVRHNSARLIAGGALPILTGRHFMPIQRMIPEPFRDKLLEGVKNAVMRQPRMSLADRAYLINIYRDDVLRLEQILDRNLERWLSACK